MQRQISLIILKTTLTSLSLAKLLLAAGPEEYATTF